MIEEIISTKLWKVRSKHTRRLIDVSDGGVGGGGGSSMT
jgi:hypothetical protein